MTENIARSPATLNVDIGNGQSEIRFKDALTDLAQASFAMPGKVSTLRGQREPGAPVGPGDSLAFCTSRSPRNLDSPDCSNLCRLGAAANPSHQYLPPP